jgi:hypothetical protein
MNKVTQYEEMDSDDLTMVVFYSLLGGSTSLIPVPFLDDWVYSVVRRQMVQTVLIRNQMKLPWEQVRELAALPPFFSGDGCIKAGGKLLIWLPLKTIFYIVTKLFKKVFFILAIKEATDRASEMFHAGYLLNYGLARVGTVSTSAFHWILPLRSCLWEINQNFDTSPIRSIFWAVLRINRQILKRAARMFRSVLRYFRDKKEPPKQEKTKQVIDEQEKILGSMVEETVWIILGDKGYLNSIRNLFDQSAKKNGLV